MGLVFLIGMASVFSILKGREWLRRFENRSCILPVTARIVAVEGIKTKQGLGIEQKATFEVADPAGTLHHQQFHMVGENDRQLSVGQAFPVYVDPNDYSHFVLIAPRSKQAVAR